jgi:hypothetical protein
MNSTHKFFGFLLLGTLALAGCKKVEKTRVYTANTPIYLTYDQLRTSVTNDNERPLTKPGKIFVYNQYILINDFESGIHIYNNVNPAFPTHVAFINVPGNVDIAVKDDILYVDSYIDIVAIDLSDPTNVREIARSQDALSYTIPGSMNYDYPVSNIDETKGVVIGYRVAEVEETCKNEECGYYYYDDLAVNRGVWEGNMMSEDGNAVSFAGNTNNVRSVSNSNTTGAIAGSMARFLMIDDFLYVISDQSTIKVFDVSSKNLSLVTTFYPWNEGGGWGNIETLFSFGDHLFIGSSTGMLAYDVSNASSPEYISNYSHMTSCDPVVANDDFAFVTLRSGTECGSPDMDQLNVLDIQDIMDPQEIGVYELNNPHGLALDSDQNLLFVCDGASGLKIFNTAEINSLKEIGSQSGDTYDVIARGNVIQVIGDGGLVQYSYDATGSLRELSRINLN